jgi:hypothetical protein
MSVVLVKSPAFSCLNPSNSNPNSKGIMPRATLRPLPLCRLTSPSAPSHLPTSFSFRLPSQHILPSIRNYFPSISRRSSKLVWPYLYSDKRIMAPQLDTYFKQVDSLSEVFIERLRKAVAIPSVSAEDERRPEVIKVKKSMPVSLRYITITSC